MHPLTRCSLADWRPCQAQPTDPPTGAPTARLILTHCTQLQFQSQDGGSSQVWSAAWRLPQFTRCRRPSLSRAPRRPTPSSSGCANLAPQYCHLMPRSRSQTPANTLLSRGARPATSSATFAAPERTLRSESAQFIADFSNMALKDSTAALEAPKVGAALGFKRADDRQVDEWGAQPGWPSAGALTGQLAFPVPLPIACCTRDGLQASRESAQLVFAQLELLRQQSHAFVDISVGSPWARGAGHSATGSAARIRPAGGRHCWLVAADQRRRAHAAARRAQSHASRRRGLADRDQCAIGLSLHVADTAQRWTARTSRRWSGWRSATSAAPKYSFPRAARRATTCKSLGRTRRHDQQRTRPIRHRVADHERSAVPAAARAACI